VTRNGSVPWPTRYVPVSLPNHPAGAVKTLPGQTASADVTCRSPPDRWLSSLLSALQHRDCVLCPEWAAFRGSQSCRRGPQFAQAALKGEGRFLALQSLEDRHSRYVFYGNIPSFRVQVIEIFAVYSELDGTEQNIPSN